jgi:3-hydroxyacyl-CoA dehydrogenase/enoyl-CoA hydratase/3-hydroxybutyryl-CoA epimerase
VGALAVSLESGVAVVTIDLPGESVNKLSRPVKDEFAAVMRSLRADAAARAVVLISGKPDTFIAGADIEEFVATGMEEGFRALSREGHAFLDELESFPKPIVVAINGACLGGGLEVSLACHYRVAGSHPRTVLALPEVQLGIIPGAGGCNRLPRLVGLRAALDMILTGKNVRPDRALRMGLVDEVVPPAILRRVAVEAAARLAGRGVPLRKSGGGWLLDRSPVGRALVVWQARKLTLKKSGGHYPALPAALEAVSYGLSNGMKRGLERESELFARMAMTDVSRRLVEIFFATTALKKDNGVPEPAPPPLPVRHLAVLGAGLMGAGIAGTAADQAGVSVRLKDADLPRVGKGIRAASDVITERLKRRSITKFEAARRLALISGGVDWAGFRHADLVIEAVFEDLEVKRAVLRETERVVKPRCVFASNTSTIPISSIAEASSRPEQVVGMHFFSPVHRMPLLEVVVGEQTAPETVVTAVAFGRKLGKTCIVVRDRPGFYVNRILAPYVSEAGQLLAEGVAVEDLDRAMVSYGFPVGPVTLLDEVGLDVAAKVAGVMQGALGERLAPAIGLDRLVAAGRLGRKNGRGFFRYERGKKRGVDGTVYADLGLGRGGRGRMGREEIAERLSILMLNEAARAVEECIVRSPRDGDIGAVFGIGFPPFRGGPLRALDAMGAGRAVEVLERLAGRHGPRFAPAAILVEQARTGGRFHPQR